MLAGKKHIMMNISMKKGIRAALALVCAGTLMVGASACGGSGSSSGGSDKVALLVSTLNNPFFVDLRDGAQAEAKKLNIDLQVSDAQNDSATQQNQAQNAQSQGAKAVIIRHMRRRSGKIFIFFILFSRFFRNML